MFLTALCFAVPLKTNKSKLFFCGLLIYVAVTPTTPQKTCYCPLIFPSHLRGISFLTARNTAFFYFTTDYLVKMLKFEFGGCAVWQWGNGMGILSSYSVKNGFLRAGFEPATYGCLVLFPLQSTALPTELPEDCTYYENLSLWRWKSRAESDRALDRNRRASTPSTGRTCGGKFKVTRVLAVPLLPRRRWWNESNLMLHWGLLCDVRENVIFRKGIRFELILAECCYL